MTDNKKHYFECKKLDKGYVIVFDYRFQECYDKGQDLVLKYRNDEMIIPHNELKKKALKLSRMTFVSQFSGGRTYGVYHFKWEPEKKEKKQQELFENKKVEIL